MIKTTNYTVILQKIQQQTYMQTCTVLIAQKGITVYLTETFSLIYYNNNKTIPQKSAPPSPKRLMTQLISIKYNTLALPSCIILDVTQYRMP